MLGKRTKDDSEAVGIIKVFKSSERNGISSKELLLLILLKEVRLAPLQNLCKSTRARVRPLLHLLTIALHVRAAEQSRPQ